MNDLFYGNGGLMGDVSVAVVVTMCAVLTYIRIGFDAKSKLFFAYGMLTAIGFSIWSARLWSAIVFGYDVVIAPLSQFGIALMCGGYAATQVLALKQMRDFRNAKLMCYRDKDVPCQREDRIAEALRHSTINWPIGRRK